MRPRGSLILFATFLLMVTFSAQPAIATTTYAQVIKCPLTGKSFVVRRVGSYTSFGAISRDLGNHPRYTFFGHLDASPWIPYAAFPADFAKVTDDEVDRLRKLAPTVLDFAKRDAAATFGIEGKQYDLLERNLRIWFVARQCYFVRSADPARDVRLAMQGYVLAKTFAPDQLSMFRKQVISTIDSALASNGLRDSELALSFYLRGEMLRCEGNHAAAIDAYASARTTAVKLNDKELEWLITWCDEQATKSRDNNSDFEPGRERYNPNAPLMSDVKLARFKQAMPKLPASDGSLCPPGWKPYECLNACAELIRAGDQEAAAMGARWILSGQGADSKYSESKVLESIDQTPSVRDSVLTEIKRLGADSSTERCNLISVACGDEEARQRVLRNPKTYDNDSLKQLCFSLFAARADRGLFDYAIAKIRGPQASEYSTFFEILYVARVVTSADLRTLEKLAEELPLPNRQDRHSGIRREHIEDVLRALRYGTTPP